MAIVRTVQYYSKIEIDRGRAGEWKIGQRFTSSDLFVAYSRLKYLRGMFPEHGFRLVLVRETVEENILDEERDSDEAT